MGRRNTNIQAPLVRFGGLGYLPYLNNRPAATQNNIPSLSTEGLQQSNNATDLKHEEIVKEASTTEFVNDGTVHETTRPAPFSLDSRLLTDASTGYVQDLIKFLEKPQRMRTGTWTSATTGTFIAIAVPEEIIAKDLVKEKVTGFLAMRATVVARLEINANRFCQGRLIMHYVPQGAIAGVNAAARNESLVTITSQPHVDLDANCDTSAIIEIPYVSPTTHYNLIDGSGNAAALYVSVYIPFSSTAGSAGADYTLWCNFKDIELVTPTIDDVYVSEMNDGSTGPRGRTRRVRKRRTGLDVTDQELAESGEGPISGTLSTISKVATAVSEVPLLSSVAGSVAWVAKLGSNVASAFGWADPTVVGPFNRVNNDMYAYANNVDGGDTALPMGLSVENKVEVVPGLGGTNFDEMSIQYISSIPAWFNTVTWADTDPGSTALATLNLDPKSFRVSFTDIASDAVNTDGWYYPPCAMFADLFKFYRGSFKIDFKIAKTEFHTGRLMVIYIPGPSTKVPTTDETAYLYREIIDIAHGNEFSFTFPFASTLPYLDTGTSYGRVIIRVLNSLKQPATVASSVSIAMEVSMCGDVEFAVLRQNGSDTSEWMVPFFLRDTNTGFVSQMNDGRSTECEIKVNGCIGPSNVPNDSCVSSALCIGEKVVSINQLLKHTTVVEQDGSGLTAGDSFILRPFTLFGSSSAKTAQATNNPLIFNDMLSLLASGFAYNRGSIRWRWFDHGTTQSRFETMLITESTPSDARPLYWNSTVIYNSHRGSFVVQDSEHTGIMSVEVPNYNQLHCRLNRYSTSQTDSSCYEPEDIYASSLHLQSHAYGTNIDPVFARQTGDDFQLGYFIGWLPIMTNRT